MAEAEQNSDSEQAKSESGQVEIATLGAGCFWCTEAVFARLPGVLSVKPGYAGGTIPNPTYKQICKGDTGHAEVARISFDPEKLTFAQLLETFWKMHDPTTLNRQGADVGTQYRSVIFYHSPEQKAAAEASKKKAAAKFEAPIVTEISEAPTFYVAEDYHHNYYNLNKNQPYCRRVIAPKLKKAGVEE
jgi:peptide-methionine (S)-S-oxide reductase